MNPFNVWEQTADGTGEHKLLWAKDGPNEAFWSPDGQTLVLGTARNDAAIGGTTQSTRHSILAAHPGVDSIARGIVVSEFDASAAALSPDSHWIAYVSNEQGANEVFVRPFPDVNSGKWQVSRGVAALRCGRITGTNYFMPPKAS
ncbi:MAG: hypothetical protein ABI120_22970 [Gemmatimonadaceae bacterium]